MTRSQVLALKRITWVDLRAPQFSLEEMREERGTRYTAGMVVMPEEGRSEWLRVRGCGIQRGRQRQSLEGPDNPPDYTLLIHLGITVFFINNYKKQDIGKHINLMNWSFGKLLLSVNFPFCEVAFSALSHLF